MGEPRYQEVTRGSIPTTVRDGATVRVVAGEFNGVSGPVTEIAASPLYMDVKLAPGARFSLPTPAGTLSSPMFSKATAFSRGHSRGREMVVLGMGRKSR